MHAYTVFIHAYIHAYRRECIVYRYSWYAVESHDNMVMHSMLVYTCTYTRTRTNKTSEEGLKRLTLRITRRYITLRLTCAYITLGLTRAYIFVQVKTELRWVVWREGTQVQKAEGLERIKEALIKDKEGMCAIMRVSVYVCVCMRVCMKLMSFECVRVCLYHRAGIFTDVCMLVPDE